MLRRLEIADFVIVDRLSLSFDDGFLALTGETGAGKSILIDALGLLLGDRADAGVIRQGATRASIEAEFDVPAADAYRAWCDAQGIDTDEGMLLVRRQIDAGGRSRCWVNGSSVTLTQLREQADWLCDIHGQHAHHALLRPDVQREMLDARLDAPDLPARVAAAYREWAGCVERLRAAQQSDESARQERELLEWRVRELDDLAFSASDWTAINAEHGRLGHAARLIADSGQSVAMLADGEASAAALLGSVEQLLQSMADIDPEISEPLQLVQSARIQCDEAVSALRRYQDRLELDPARLDELEQRIGAITDIARKYRVDPDALPELAAASRARLQTLVAMADLDALKADEARALDTYRKLASALSDARSRAASVFGEQVSDALQTLSMQGARFVVRLAPLGEPGRHGDENVIFDVAANAGQSPRPLAKAASGGELSRISLAIQVLSRQADDTPTMIFDEVDVGIGGSVAEVVGRMLRRLGQTSQVLCVTHLPQVAACAHRQWQIAKSLQGDQTLSRVAALDDDGRIDEIARMLGGMTITETTRQHAAEMLALAAHSPD